MNFPHAADCAGNRPVKTVYLGKNAQGQETYRLDEPIPLTDPCSCHVGEIDRLTLDRDQWKRTAEQLRQESEALTADNEALRLDNAALLRIKATSNALEAQLEAERDLARQQMESMTAELRQALQELSSTDQAFGQLNIVLENESMTAALKVAEEALAMAVDTIRHYEQFEYRSEILSDGSIQFKAEQALLDLEAALQTLRQVKTSVPQAPPGERIP